MVVIVVPIMIVLLMLSHICQSTVQVQDGKLAFPLESVKKMKELLGKDAKPGSASARSQSQQVTFLQLCLNPELPKDLRPVCDREDAPDIFRRLGRNTVKHPLRQLLSRPEKTIAQLHRKLCWS